jgi:hypothetical protein
MEAEAVETIEGRHGLTARIYPDWESRSPREDYDNVGTLALEDYGDEQPPRNWGEYADTLEPTIRELRRDGNTVLPLRLEDYGSSGARLRVTDAEDANGYIYAGREKIAEEWGEGRKARKKARAYLRGEVAEMDAVLQGEVYGWAIENTAGDVLESVWGFIGEYDPDPAKWYVVQEAREALEAAELEADERLAARARMHADAIAQLGR